MTGSEKNAIHNLKEAELYKLIIETANEGIWMIDEQNTTTFVNEKMSEMLGYEPAEMKGRTLFDFMDEEGVTRAIENLKRGKEGISEYHEFRFLSKKGVDVWTNLNTSPIEVEGVYKGALAMATDITQSKIREEKLQENYYSYLSLFEDSPVPIWDENFSEIKIYIDELKKEGISDFRTFFQQNPEELVECTSRLIINNINQAVVDLNEAETKEQVLENFRQLITSKSSEYAIEQLVAIAENRTSCEFDAELKTLGGNIRYVHFKWSVVKGYEHNYEKVYLSTTDMTKRIIDENITLQHSNREKAVLLREVHHRVKNNLQIITSLLNLQSHGIEDQEMRNVFNMSLNRIKSMATVHELLYQSNEFAGIDYSEYLNTLVFSLIKSMKGKENNITVDLDVKDVKLNIGTSIPLGLLINEIITNSLKHGIPDERPGKIYISITQHEHPNYALKIGDNGKGISQDFDMAQTDTLGLQLVTSLVDQLIGTLEHDFSKPGTHYNIQFQELEQQG
jgi:PAS domain S-box-containing protein